MIPTPIGAVVILMGIWLLFRPAAEMFVFVLFCSLFAGASAVDAIALGHSSIPPGMLALAFLGLRILRRDLRRGRTLWTGARLNAWLIVYCAYGAASAFILPKIFAGRVNVMPMAHANIIMPLFPSSQNITQALYLLASGFAAVAGSAVATRPGAAELLIRGFLMLAWVHILTGLADLAASAAHIDGLFDIVRNGAYQQLSQEEGMFHRISGLTPEPSDYAALGFIFFVVLAELWLRSVRSRVTGATALCMLFMLLLSTSSTAYASVAAYAALLGVRVIFFPGSVSLERVAALIAVGVLMVVAAGFLLLLKPGFASKLGELVTGMTVGKAQTTSGLERAMWARQGWDLFLQTRGLGVGIGSFRSSNIFTAILGSFGAASLVILLVYHLLVLRLDKRSTFMGVQAEGADLGAALAWAAILQLVPGALIATSADPGLLFALCAGAALTLRSSLFSPRGPRTAPVIARSGLLPAH